MTRTVPFSASALVVLLVAGQAATAAAPRGGFGENPRAPWLERYQESRQGPEQTETVDGTYKVGRDGALDLSSIAGDVRVTAGSGDEIRIRAIKRVRHRDAAEAKRLLQALRVDITDVAGRVEVRTVYPRVRNVSASVDFTIEVPPQATAWVKTISGNVSVTGVRGEVRAETVSGDVEVTATPNLAVAKTVSGNVTARDIAASSLTLGAVSGDIIATGLKTRSLDAGTVSGNIRLTGSQIERLQAKSVSGDLTYEAPLTRGGRYEFNSHSGNVRLVLSGDTGFDLDANSFSGSIRSDFPVTLRSNSAESRRRQTSAVRGSYGDASAILSIRSFNGTIVITRK